MQADTKLRATVEGVVQDHCCKVWGASTPLVRGFARWLTLELVHYDQARLPEMLGEGNPGVDSLSVAWAAVSILNPDSTQATQTVLHLL